MRSKFLDCTPLKGEHMKKTKKKLKNVLKIPPCPHAHKQCACGAYEFTQRNYVAPVCIKLLKIYALKKYNTLPHIINFIANGIK